MSLDRGQHQPTHSLPIGLSEALAYYDRLAETGGSRDRARQEALERYSQWSNALREHFRVEDCLLGVTDSPFDSTQLGLPPDQSAPGATAGPQSRLIPRYLLGVGGQGEVWLAHDPELDRFVALKVIKEAQRGSQPTAARFWREAELTGKLEHPNIVPVYEAGRSAGQDDESHAPYYVMRVFGNRHLLRAITAFHARERRPQDWELLEAIKAFHEKRSTEHSQRLQQALGSFPFDNTQECDQDLKDACEALRKDPAGQSGRSLQEAITAYHASGRQPSELRELLGRFIDVCNAMAYAHSRGVIHRDLKPQNVMLGEFGETLVVDWGLAKVVERKERTSDAIPGDTLKMSADESDRDTQQGTVVGTLAYMPPEQAWGKIDELTAATDVYSLGGILYMLLTGLPPRTGTSKTQLLEAARSGQVAAPTSLQPDVPKALEAVCLKALSKSTGQRYSTAKDLSADVGRWLADEPVSAWPEPLVVRAKRWVKGHQTLVGSTAAAVLVAVVTLSALVAIVTGKNDELNTAYELEEAARILAQNNEQAAREQSQLALSTLTQVIFDVQRGLENLPGGGEVRRSLLATSLDKLEQVATEYVEQSTVDHNTMVALMDMGDVILGFGTGEIDDYAAVLNPGAPAELGEEAQSAVQLAHRFYNRSQEHGLELLAEEPDNDQLQRNLAVCLNRLGVVSRTAGALSEAEVYFERALETFEALAVQTPDDKRLELDRSLTFDHVGDVRRQLGQLGDALSAYEDSLQLREQLALDHPDDAEVQRVLAISLGRLNEVYLQMRRLDEASSYGLRSLEIFQQLAEAQVGDALRQRDLSFAFLRCGMVNRELSQTREASVYFGRALEIHEQLVSKDPTSTRAAIDLTISLYQLGYAELQLENVPEAQRHFLRLYDVQSALAERDPANHIVVHDLAVSLNQLGDLSMELGQFVEGKDYYSQARDLFAELAGNDPTNTLMSRNLSIAQNRLGDVELAHGQPHLAVEAFEGAVQIAEQLAAVDQADTQAQWDLAISHRRLADAKAAVLDYVAAVNHYSSALAVLDLMIEQGQDVDECNKEREYVLDDLRIVERDAAKARSAVGDWDAFIRQPGARSRLPLRIKLLAREGRFNEIPQSAEMLRSLNAENFDNLYNAARGYAMCAGAIQPAAGETLTTEQQNRRQEYIDLALACLRESIAAGWTDFEHMQQDPDLTILRDLPEFQAMIPSLPEPDSEQE